MSELTRSESLLHPRGHRPKVSVHFPWRGAKDEGYNGFAGDVDVLESAQDVDLGVCEDDAGARRVLDCEFCLAVLAGYAAYGSRLVVAG